MLFRSSSALRTAVLTTPLSAEPSSIRNSVPFAAIPDRREAIAQALAMAVDEDVVLLAGKGHEREVHLPGGSYECDDREVARRVLHELFPARA